MQLDPAKLENVKELAGGAKRARCPACAEAGHDKTGNHLLIKPDGRFGCCVFADDKPHRQRIFALASDRKERIMVIRQPLRSAPVERKTGLFDRINRTMTAPVPVLVASVATILDTPASMPSPPAPAPAPPSSDTAHTPATTPPPPPPKPKSRLKCLSFSQMELLRTARTPDSNLLQEEEKLELPAPPQKEVTPPVRGVRESSSSLPHLLADGTLVIPFNSPKEYHWWNGGQSVSQTRAEFESGFLR